MPIPDEEFLAVSIDAKIDYHQTVDLGKAEVSARFMCIVFNSCCHVRMPFCPLCSAIHHTQYLKIASFLSAILKKKQVACMRR